jgi:HK97 family phage prohead protease
MPMKPQKQLKPNDGYSASGYATVFNTLCSDGRTIKHGAFAENEGTTVPLLYQHLHKEMDNIVGHAMLENDDYGTYAYLYFNDLKQGKDMKHMVHKKDLNSLSIFANELVESKKTVTHGVIRELSVVLSGANGLAKIDNLVLAHSDEEVEDEAIIFMGDLLEVLPDTLSHADANEGMTIGQIFDGLSEIEKEAMYTIIANAVEAVGGASSEAPVAHSDDSEGDIVKENVFNASATANTLSAPTLSHSQFAAIVEEASKPGIRFKDAMLKHAVTYGIDHVELLFPDAHDTTKEPILTQRDTAWVGAFLNATTHSPFSRIRTTTADLTYDSARAKGYVTGAVKTEVYWDLAQRTTTAATWYIKQKMDRDTILEITTMDVVAWIWKIMNVQAREELARAILVSDGRAANDPDKIKEANIRPIYKENPLYAHRVSIPKAHTYEDMIEDVIRARKLYKGSGNPTFFTTTDVVVEMLLVKDENGRRIYSNQKELEDILRVNAIVEVPVLEGVTRETEDAEPVTMDLIGILVNPKDYTIGTDAGGELTKFDSFDLDVNQYKYLLEGRCSGALTLFKSALIFEQIAD